MPIVTEFEKPKGGAKGEIDLRFIVVESVEGDGRPDGQVDRAMKRELKKYELEKKKLMKKEFGCEHDARAAIKALTSGLKLYSASLVPVVVTKPVKRKRPGRPPKDEVREVRSIFKVEETSPPTENEEYLARRAFHARHFVLVTDRLDEEVWPDERVLREYRAQQVVEGHTGFRWLKSIALVAPLFLHLPTRIAALGLVFVLALMVRNYIQATIREQLEAQNKTLPDRLDRPTKKPTMETAMRQLAGVVTTRIYIRDKLVEKRIQGLGDAGRLVLDLLGMDEDVYLKPPGSRKWVRVPRRIPEM